MMSATRNGNFTSSAIHALMTFGKATGSFGKPALTYIAERNMERRLGRSLTEDITARALSWGKLNEKTVFDMLGTEYRLCSDITLDHPDIDVWKGSPDAEKYDPGKTVADVKCPITLKSFCQLVDPLYDGHTGMEAMDLIRETHPDGDKFYYQLVSNGCITGARYGELIVYCPYQSELTDIRHRAAHWDGEKQHRFQWVDYSSDDELPHLINGGFYKNLNIIRFEIPKRDKIMLTERVLEAATRLKQPERFPLERIF